jgi:hypothetical protein
MIRRTIGGLVVVTWLLVCTGCRTGDAVRDGISAGISDTIAAIIVALLVPEGL